MFASSLHPFRKYLMESLSKCSSMMQHILETKEVGLVLIHRLREIKNVFLYISIYLRIFVF